MHLSLVSEAGGEEEQTHQTRNRWAAGSGPVPAPKSPIPAARRRCSRLLRSPRWVQELRCLQQAQQHRGLLPWGMRSSSPRFIGESPPRAVTALIGVLQRNDTEILGLDIIKSQHGEFFCRKRRQRGRALMGKAVWHGTTRGQLAAGSPARHGKVQSPRAGSAAPPGWFLHRHPQLVCCTQPSSQDKSFLGLRAHRVPVGSS